MARRIMFMVFGNNAAAGSGSSGGGEEELPHFTIIF